MDTALAVGICLTCFVGGIVFSKIVLSDLQSIKEHVSGEAEYLRAEIAALLSEAAKKV